MIITSAAGSALLFLIASVILWDRHLSNGREERERHFIAVHTIASEASWDAQDAPADLAALLDKSAGARSLMRPFPESLIYRPEGASFTLEEPRARLISWLRRDRLIATDRNWPRWETSGLYARKSSDQEVPPSGFE
ncbi:MAG: hypothetical protein EOP85_18780 [Verrucomicrobiaceae bacterium]|nr:MAG: hypothetical protein EOP85_18780 [Verrucomicrobiaceae bacterium]